MAPSFLIDDGHPEWRRYPLSALQCVLVKRSATANEIHVKTGSGKTHVYGIGNRGYTEEYRAALRQFCGERYKEDGFQW